MQTVRTSGIGLNARQTAPPEVIAAERAYNRQVARAWERLFERAARGDELYPWEARIVRNREELRRARIQA